MGKRRLNFQLVDALKNFGSHSEKSALNLPKEKYRKTGCEDESPVSLRKSNRYKIAEVVRILQSLPNRHSSQLIMVVPHGSNLMFLNCSAFDARLL
jgi:hypothetical protein